MSQPISPSQIKTFFACPRKWGYSYLEGIKEPASPAAQLGIDVHSRLEEYYRSGLVPCGTEKANYIALAYIAADTTGSTGSTEQAFTIESRRWRGFIDMIGPGFIRDHKTTSDLKWALNEDTLASDPQALIYAAHYFDAYEMAEIVTLQWHYVTTRPPYKTRQVHLEVRRDEDFNDKMAELERINDTLQQHYENNAPETLRKNLSSCNQYGGCYYKDKCNPNPMFNLNETTMPDTTPISRAQSDGWKFHPNNNAYMYQASLPKEQQKAVFVTEVEAMYPEPEAPAIPAAPFVPQAVNPPVEDFRPVNASNENVENASPALEALPKRGPGRPRKDGAPPQPKVLSAQEKQAQSFAFGNVSLANDSVTRETIKSAAESMSNADIPVLYIDCVPMSFSRPQDIVRTLLTTHIPALEKANEVQHWKQVPYGGGTSLLVIAARSALGSSKGDIFLDTRTEEGSAILSTCIAHIVKEGGFAVRGIR